MSHAQPGASNSSHLSRGQAGPDSEAPVSLDPLDHLRCKQCWKRYREAPGAQEGLLPTGRDREGWRTSSAGGDEFWLTSCVHLLCGSCLFSPRAESGAAKTAAGQGRTGTTRQIDGEGSDDVLCPLCGVLGPYLPLPTPASTTSDASPSIAHFFAPLPTLLTQLSMALHFQLSELHATSAHYEAKSERQAEVLAAARRGLEKGKEGRVASETRIGELEREVEVLKGELELSRSENLSSRSGIKRPTTSDGERPLSRSYPPAQGRQQILRPLQPTRMSLSPHYVAGASLPKAPSRLIAPPSNGRTHDRTRAPTQTGGFRDLGTEGERELRRGERRSESAKPRLESGSSVRAELSRFNYNPAVSSIQHHAPRQSDLSYQIPRDSPRIVESSYQPAQQFRAGENFSVGPAARVRCEGRDEYEQREREDIHYGHDGMGDAYGGLQNGLERERGMYGPSFSEAMPPPPLPSTSSRPRTSFVPSSPMIHDSPRAPPSHATNRYSNIRPQRVGTPRMDDEQLSYAGSFAPSRSRTTFVPQGAQRTPWRGTPRGRGPGTG